jgi:hypothetical protein
VPDKRNDVPPAAPDAANGRESLRNGLATDPVKSLG